ncbi:hypothetical protein DW085_01780 [Clostridium sp. AF50-3]|nr:hypothetical protein DW085_01780 [Clostridium sp. AF50-3]
MAVFDINNFAIDHVLRGLMVSQADGSVMWSINQITEPSLNLTSETSEVTDVIGSTMQHSTVRRKPSLSPITLCLIWDCLQLRAVQKRLLLRRSPRLPLRYLRP